MASVNSQQPLLPSLLDRLIDTEPDQSSEPLWRGSYRLDKLREDVRRDLEYLLNTRHGRFELITQPGELAISTLTYGLHDLAGIVGGGVDTYELIRATVERAVRNYEPRLTNVIVEVREPEQEFERNVRLTIRAVLYVDPILEHITFDTTVEAATGTCEIRAS